MVKFTPYFYKFKEMLLDKNIPVEFRAMFIDDKAMASLWRKRYNYNMYTDSEVSDKNFYWRDGLSYKLHKVTVKDIGSVIEMDTKHPEISTSDLIIALILWGRGPAIVKSLLRLNPDIPEYEELSKVLDASKKWRKEKKSLPRKPRWSLR